MTTYGRIGMRRMRRKASGETSGHLLRADEPIGFRRLRRETLGLLKRSWGKAWGAWLGVLAAQAAVYLVAAGFAEPMRGLSAPAASLLTVAEVGATSVPFGFGLRLALGAPRPLALDAGLAASVGLNALAAVIVSAWSLAGDAITSERVASLVLELGMDPTAELGMMAALHGGFLVGYLGLTVVFVMLSLWPLELLLRRAGASPSKSWRDMKGACLPILIVFGLYAVLSEIALWGLRSLLPPYALGDDMSLLHQFAASLAYYPVNVLIMVAYGAVWLVRSGDGAKRVAAFD
jgi:hypothetical protein